MLDMLVMTAAAGSAAPHAEVYRTFAAATGRPSPLPAHAALYWQSKDAYKNQTEVVAVARALRAKGLAGAVGVVCSPRPPNHTATRPAPAQPHRHPPRARPTTQPACGGRGCVLRPA